jgi:hypothetical protein
MDKEPITTKDMATPKITTLAEIASFEYASWPKSAAMTHDPRAIGTKKAPVITYIRGHNSNGIPLVKHMIGSPMTANPTRKYIE